MAVGRREAVEADDLGPRRQPLGRSEAVGPAAGEFPFAALVGEHHEALAVADEARRPGPDALLAVDTDPAAVADRGDEDVPTGNEDDPVAAGGDVPGCQVVERLGHPPLAHLVEIRRQGDGEGRVVAGADVEDVEVGDELVSDPSRIEAGGAGVESFVEGVLLEPAALEVHRPDVHGAVAIAQEVDPALPDHGVLARAGVVGRQGGGLVGADRVRPEVLGRAAFIPFGVTALERKPREIERPACRIERSVRGLAEREHGLGRRRRIKDDKLGVGQGRILLGGVEDLPVGSPADDRAALSREGAANGQAARERHRVDLGRALVLGGKGQGQAVRRDGRIGLHPVVGGQAPGRPAARIDRPEVALGGEDDRVAVNGREPVIAVPAVGRPGRRGGAGQDKAEDTQDDAEEDEGSFHEGSFPGEVRAKRYSIPKHGRGGNDFGCQAGQKVVS